MFLQNIISMYFTSISLFLLQAEMSEEPEIAPTVRCITDIYHPNIDRYSCLGTTNVCLNLFDEWQPDFGLQDVVQGLLFLLHNPAPGHALLDGFDPEKYEKNVAKNKEGLEIGSGVSTRTWKPCQNTWSPLTSWQHVWRVFLRNCKKKT